MAAQIDTQSTVKPQKKKKKWGYWDIEEHIGSVSIKLHRVKEFDANRGQDDLKKAGWRVNETGRIVGLEDGRSPRPDDEPDMDLVQQFVSFVWTDPEYYNFRCIEIKEDSSSKVPPALIYVSPDYHTKKTVMMLIPGTGIVNAGEWATSVNRYDNLVIGTAFPFIEWALDRDIGVVLFDPNTLHKPDETKPMMRDIHCIHVFDTFVRPYLSGMESKHIDDQNVDNKEDENQVDDEDNGQNQDVDGQDTNGNVDGNINENDDGKEEVLAKNVDDKDNGENQDVDVQDMNENDDGNNNGNDDEEKEEVLTEEKECENAVENLLILAHSAGGKRTTYLLRERGAIIQRYIRAIAFTDIRDPKGQVFQSRKTHKEETKIIKEIYKDCARNWVKTKKGKKLGKPMKMAKGVLVEKVSSSHAHHKYTSAAAFPSVIKFFDEKMSAIDR